MPRWGPQVRRDWRWLTALEQSQLLSPLSHGREGLIAHVDPDPGQRGIHLVVITRTVEHPQHAHRRASHEVVPVGHRIGHRDPPLGGFLAEDQVVAQRPVHGIGLLDGSCRVHEKGWG